MTKITSIAVAAATVLAFAACKNAGYKKTSSGIMYKVVTEGSGPQVKVGEFIKVNYTQSINRNGKDSVLGTSNGTIPAYTIVDSVGPIYQPNEIFRLLHKGDSVVILQLADSLIAKNPMGPMSVIKKGDKLTLAIKVIDVFAKEDALKADRDKEMEKEKSRQLTNLESELKNKKINAQKEGKGTFVAVQNPGEGTVIDSGKYVTVTYTGRLFDNDTVFDSNVGKEPFGFTVGQQGIIPGWSEGMKGLKKGAKATMYIPGFLAYGPQGPGGPQHQTLKFDVEVLDIADKAPAPKMQAPIPMPHDTSAAKAKK